MSDRLVDAATVRSKVQKGDRPVSDMTLFRWVRKGVIPPPDRVIEGKRFWRESTIDRALGLSDHEQKP